MAKIYRELYEPTGMTPPPARERKETKLFFNRITYAETTTKEGEYRSLFLQNDLFSDERLKKRVKRELRAILLSYFDKYGIKKGDKVLVAALGNEQVTADRLGCAVADRVTVTSHLYPYRDFGNLSAVKCGVSGTTGLESARLLRAVTDAESPAIVLAIDALACSKTDRLARAVQVTDAGIEPGGGVGNAKEMISRLSLGVPVVAIGVPTVMYARKILAEFCKGDFAESETLKTLTVAAKEIDYQIKDYADVIASAIDGAVHGIKGL